MDLYYVANGGQTEFYLRLEVIRYEYYEHFLLLLGVLKSLSAGQLCVRTLTHNIFITSLIS